MSPGSRPSGRWRPRRVRAIMRTKGDPSRTIASRGPLVARVRVSLAGVMGAIAAFSLLWASMRYASRPCAELVFTATLGVLGIAALGGIFRIGKAKVRWAGFAVLGGGYLALCYGPGFGSEIRAHLATSYLLDAIGPRIVHPRVVDSWSDGRGRGVANSILAAPEDIVSSTPNNQPVVTAINMTWPAVIWTRTVGTGDPEDFQRIGHCWLALGLGMVGGTLARRFRGMDQGTSADPDIHS
jgi:hypothetical protein